MKQTSFKNFNRENPSYRYFNEIDNTTYIFLLDWNKYDNCIYLTITDYEDNPIIMGRALVNNLVIRSDKLPYVFGFIHKYGETYEPTIDNIADEFALVYEDGE